MPPADADAPATVVPAAVVPAAVVPALAALDGVERRPLEEHVAVFDAVHRGLQDALAVLDEP